MRKYTIKYQFFKVIKSYEIVAINYNAAINDFVFKTGISRKNITKVI
jgi:hypothetical protein